MVVITTLLRTDDVLLADAHCSATTPEMSDEEIEPGFSVVFPRSGLYVRHVAGERVVANPAVALFFNRHEVQRTSHPNGSGDRSVLFSLSRRFVAPFLNPRTGSFPLRAKTTTGTMDMTIRLLVRDSTRGYATPLDLEERTLRILRSLLGNAKPGAPHSRHQGSVVADAQEYLTDHFADDSDLQTVAREVGSSPHHLSRLFHSVTGTTMSAYRTQLRIRAAVAQLSGGASDVSRVAVEVGVYDHAHRANTIRRHLRSTPTAIRFALRPMPLGEPGIDLIGPSRPEPLGPWSSRAR